MPTPADPDVSALLSVRQAIDILDAEPVVPRIVRLPLGRCRGLRLAQDVVSDRDYPPFDKSLMDGYAVRAKDIAAAPVDLPVVGVIPAGHWPEHPLEPGETMAIMTGAPMPAGSDATVPVEQTQELGAEGDVGRVRILTSVAAGYAVARQASDMAAGRIVLARGSIVDAPAIAVAASVGAAELEVYARPRVAILGTGDEIIPIDQAPTQSQIRNSNNPMLVALLERLGCDVTDLGIVADDEERIRASVQQGLGFDALFVTGGMSMGQFDFVPKALVELGVTLKITKVRVKPGKPFVFGVGGGEGLRASVPDASVPSSPFVFGLPGNPLSAFVCTLRLASRVIVRMSGGMPQDRWLTGRLDVGLPANGPREFYQPVMYRQPGGLTSRQNELPSIEPLAWKGSADVFTLARANALLVRSENEPTLPKGTMVRVLEI
ncbi:molybdopterin molybdotransferase MoeA [Humisphaera borealis]|uniref:Molybdopterin molybdenumtransferase n=1 Tax=Humisphaera borealis TaxID=2807512 RepID=A0A7M2WSW8_9BACT|nr:gephyrin-like molybdotransferase Glp [Humisphaera borealis]QOV87911.1 molybdopterin molybdotransferase MoeA [Humisphaera borealis]